jgi:phosphoenolpyruvate carboxylase
MSKNKISKYFIFISILTFFVIFLLIVHEAYNKQVKQINEVKEDVTLKSFDPELDMDTIKDIIKKEDIKN